MMEPVTHNDENFNRGVPANFLQDNGYDQDDIEYLKKSIASAREIREDFFKPITDKLAEINPQINLDEVMPKIALQKGCYAPSSDCHADPKILINQLASSGAIILDKEGEETYVEVDINANKVHDTPKKILEAQQELKNGNLKHNVERYNPSSKQIEIKTKDNELINIPHFELNPNFKGKIYFLGDFEDKGKKSSECLAIMQYINFLNKDPKTPNQKTIDVKYLIGNHEIPYINGKWPDIYPDNYEAIKKMITDGLLQTCSTEKINNGKTLIFQHTNYSMIHLLTAITFALKLMTEGYIIHDNNGHEEYINKEFSESQEIFMNNLQQYGNLKEKLGKLKNANIDFEQYSTDKDWEAIKQMSADSENFNLDSIYEKYSSFKNLLMESPYNFTIDDFLLLKNLIGNSTYNLHICLNLENEEIKKMLSDESEKINPISKLGWIYGADFLSNCTGNEKLKLELEKLDAKTKFEDTVSVEGHIPDREHLINIKNGSIMDDTYSSDGCNKTYSSYTQLLINKDLNFFKTNNYKINAETNEVQSEETNIKYDETNESKTLKGKEISLSDGLLKMFVPSNNIKMLINEIITEVQQFFDDCIFIDKTKNLLNNIINVQETEQSQKIILINENLNLLYNDCLVIQNFSEATISLYTSKFQKLTLNEKLNILKIHKNEQIELQSRYKKFSTLISNSLLEKTDKDYLINIVNNLKINFSAKLVTINLHLNVLYRNYLSSIRINTSEEKIPYLNEFNKLSIEDKINALSHYKKMHLWNITYNIKNYFPKTETQKDLADNIFHQILERKSVSEIKNYLNEQFIKIFTETFPNSSEKDINSFKEKSFENKSTILKFSYKFSSFINKSKMTEEEKTNAMEKFKKENSDTKKSIIDRIEKMEKQNEENFKAKNFRTLPLHKIPPLEPGDEIHI